MKLTNKNYTVYLFQPMQGIFVERTFCNLLFVYGRGRRRCGDPTILSDRLPLVGNAHRAFRGEKHGRMPCGRSTGNIKFTEQIHNVNFNPCIVRPSNARFVIFCMFTVADAARRHGLRIACGCVPRRYAHSVVPPLQKKSRRVSTARL